VIQYAPAALLLPLVTPHPVQPSGVRIDVPPSSRFARHEHLLRSRRSTRRMDQHSDAPPADTTYSPRLPVNDGKMRCGRHLFFVRYDSVDKDRNNDLSAGMSFLSARRAPSAVLLVLCSVPSVQTTTSPNLPPRAVTDDPRTSSVRSAVLDLSPSFVIMISRRIFGPQWSASSSISL
jgi:hypothetical protein